MDEFGINIGDLLEVDAPLIAWRDETPEVDFVFYDGFLVVVDCYESALGLEAILITTARGILTVEHRDLLEKSTLVSPGSGPKVSTVLNVK